MLQRKCLILHHMENTDSYSMFNLLTDPQLFDHVEALLPAHRERSFPPTETLSMYMAQVLSPDGSCQQVANHAAVKRLVGGLKPCSTSTSANCQARSRLPLTMISTLTRQTGGIITQEAISWWNWRGRQGAF